LINKDDLFSNHDKLSKNFGLSLHILPAILEFMGGEFTKIQLNEKNEVQLEFSIPFGLIKSRTLNNTIYSPQVKGTAKRTIVDGKYILFSPLTKFSKKTSQSKWNQNRDSRISVIRETMKNAESLSSDKMLNAL